MKDEAKEEMVRLLRDYEQWEGDLILSDEAWDGGVAEFPTITEELWDRLLVLQTRRGKILASALGPVLFETSRTDKPLSEITAADIPPGLDASDVCGES